MGTGFLSLEVKPLGRESDIPPFSAEVKNEFKVNHHSFVCLHGVDRVKFTFAKPI
jgi:hypothetical protein